MAKPKTSTRLAGVFADALNSSLGQEVVAAMLSAVTTYGSRGYMTPDYYNQQTYVIRIKLSNIAQRMRGKPEDQWRRLWQWLNQAIPGVSMLPDYKRGYQSPLIVPFSDTQQIRFYKYVDEKYGTEQQIYVRFEPLGFRGLNDVDPAELEGYKKTENIDAALDALENVQTNPPMEIVERDQARNERRFQEYMDAQKREAEDFRKRTEDIDVTNLPT